MSKFLKIQKNTVLLSSTVTGESANKLIDSTQDFTTNGVVVGDLVYRNGVGTAFITAIDSATQLSISADLFAGGPPSGENYQILDASNTEGDDDILNASEVLFVDAQSNGNVRYYVGEDVSTGYVEIVTSASTAAEAEEYVQSIITALGNIEEGKFLNPVPTINVLVPEGIIVVGASFA